MRFLLGTDAPTPKWLGVAWVTLAGYVMGTIALEVILGSDRSLGTSDPVRILVLGLAPAGLSGLAAILGIRGRDPMSAGALTLVGSFVASLFCAPVTWVLLLLLGGGNSGGDNLLLLLPVTVIGAFIGGPLGLFFGAIFAIGLYVQTWLRGRPARGSLDLGLTVMGVGWLALGVAAVLVVPTLPGSLFGSAYTNAAAHSRLGLSWLPWVLVGVGALATAVGAGRTVFRLVLARQARRGAWPGWAVVSPDEVDDVEDLPRLFPFGRTDGVLVQRAADGAGPFRSSESVVGIARLSM